MDHELLRAGGSVAARCACADGRRRRLSRGRSCVARYARPGARGLYRLAQRGHVRRAIPVRAGPRRKTAVLGEVGFAGLGPVDRWPCLAARWLPGIGRPVARLALASSGRCFSTCRRVRSDRRGPRVDSMVAPDGARAVRPGRVGLALRHRRIRRSVRICARRMDGIDRANDIGCRRAAARDRRPGRLAHIDGHGRELSRCLSMFMLSPDVDDRTAARRCWRACSPRPSRWRAASSRSRSRSE